MKHKTRFVTLKDLPFAKAGTVLTSEETVDAGTKVYIQGETFSNQKESILIGYANELLSSGWIEEVKRATPREWYEIALRDDMTRISDQMPYIHYAEATKALEALSRDWVNLEIIKVREVIE